MPETSKPELPTSSRVQWVAFEPKRFRRGIIALLAILTIYTIVVWLFDATSHFLFLVLLALLLAIAMEPSIRFFERRGLRRGFGTGITLFFGLFIACLTIVLLGGVFTAQSAGLIQSFPTLVTQTVDWLNTTFGLTINASDIISQFNLDASQLASLATDFGGGVIGAIGTAFAIIFDFFTVLVFAFFIAADGPRLRRTVASWLPPRQQRVLITVWDISLQKTGGFVVSKVVLAGISAFAHTIFFAVIQLPYWLPMGIFAGLTSQLIPTVGTYIGVIVPILVGGLDRPFFIISIIAFATVYQQVENYVLTPKVSRATMDLHPAIALAAVFIGAAIWGPIGAIIGIPIAAAAIAVIDAYGKRYELVAEMQESLRQHPSVQADLAAEGTQAGDSVSDEVVAEAASDTIARMDEKN